MEHHYAEFNGIRMHYVTHGTGKPLVLLHGFPEYWGVWRGLMRELEREYQLIAPDLRGYNLTSKPEGVEHYRIQHLVADVRGLADHLGLERFNLLVQDWGALVGWNFLLRHPERVERFMTIDITHPALFLRDLRTNPQQQKASQYMLLFRQPGAAEDYFHANDFAAGRQEIFGDARRHGALLSAEQEEEWVEVWKQPGALTAGFNYYRAAELGPPDGKGHPGGGNMLDDLNPEQFLVRAPVLVMWAEKDTALLQCGLEGLEQYVPDLTIRRVPDATHWLSLEKPAVVAQHVREFLAR
ncbi:alpha/beta hydrolase [Archangium violaceum]|uniref:alpha/beta fold hydrolase n=1 Tax=Archangium violaceum TaxID=83451 RepID=UPI00193B20D9|nr:alpha/beta hydrolase [Archangium violaceum]QRK07928.1 alpha/beta hydrolase [Archangium violaceum]